MTEGVQHDAWVIDTSALIAAKGQIPATSQWEVFRNLETMVEQGQLFFPRQVTAELRQARHIDTPEAWALAVGPKVTRAYDPQVTLVRQVMAVAGDVLDADAEGEPADPYVIAQALQLANEGVSICVVTEDMIDHLPLRISMATACGRVNLPYCRLSEFLEVIT